MRCLLSKSLFLVLLVHFLVSQAVSQDPLGRPNPAHAHNDYLHERPLFDAMENGFRSIEADVFRVGDSLFVAHDRKDMRPGRTLRALYLAPLLEYFSDAEDPIYDSALPLILLVDIKDSGQSTYQLLDSILGDFSEILCRVTGGVYTGASVMLVVSGNRPIDHMRDQTRRLAFVDGRIKDLEEDYTPHLMPLISDRWGTHFTWKGKGEMPEQERAQLRTYVQGAHDKGQMLRFWATPDAPGREREAVWNELIQAGVDLINTDDLKGLNAFLSLRGY